MSSNKNKYATQQWKLFCPLSHVTNGVLNQRIGVVKGHYIFINYPYVLGFLKLLTK